MSFANPTPIRLSLTGTFNDRAFRVAGRVVMGMEDRGETYYWNEFNLANDDGESATLVYEETERGGEWRLFTLFEVEYPLTAADAASKRVGERLTLDDGEVRVTLVDESRVYFIEGEAPEGVEVGDVAHYFNAETSQRMIVVSWTDDEVEYYRGVTLSAKTIATAFNLPGERFTHAPSALRSGITSAWQSGDDREYLSAGKFFRAVCIGLGLLVLVAFFICKQSGWTRAVVTKTTAPATPLALGSAGTLDGKSYHVQGHAVVEIAQTGRIYDRHEYDLFDEEGNRSLLIYGLKPGTTDWFLFTPLQPIDPLTPARAAALKLGDVVNVDGFLTPVNEISQCVLRQTESLDLPDLKSGTLLFSFSTQAGPTPLLARWNQDGIRFYRGRLVPTKLLDAAFHRAAKS